MIKYKIVISSPKGTKTKTFIVKCRDESDASFLAHAKLRERKYRNYGIDYYERVKHNPSNKVDRK
jgi:hypothetical protein